MMRLTNITALLLLSTRLLAQSELTLVADLCPGGCSGNPQGLTVFNDKLYFYANTPATGQELFSYDGGPVILAAEFTPGPGDGAPGNASPLFFQRDFPVLDGRIYVQDVNLNIYSSNGADAFSPVSSGSGTSLKGDLRNSCIYNGSLFLTSEFGGVDEMPVCYNPVKGSISRVPQPSNYSLSFNKGTASSNLVIFQGKLTFLAYGIQLQTGTNVAAIVQYSPETGTSATVIPIDLIFGYATLVPHAGSLYFAPNALSWPGTNPIYRYDGTGDPYPIPFLNDSTSTGSGYYVNPRSYGPYIVFEGTTPTYGQELMKYDPATNAASIVTDIQPGSEAANVSAVPLAFNVSPFPVAGGLYYFAAAHDAPSDTLGVYIYDCGKDKVQVLYKSYPGVDVNALSNFGSPTLYKGSAYFSAFSYPNGTELYHITAPLQLDHQQYRPSQLFTASPNPATTSLSISIQGIINTRRTAHILSPLGALLLTHPFTGTSTTLSTESLPAGTYFLTVTEGSTHLGSLPFVKR